MSEKTFVGAFIRRNGRLLAYKHIGKSPAWRIPGGKLELGEHPKQGILRELAEETGFPISLVDATLFLTTKNFIDGAVWHGHLYNVYVPEFYQAHLMEPHKCNALGWFTDEELSQMDYFDGTNGNVRWAAPKEQRHNQSAERKCRDQA